MNPRLTRLLAACGGAVVLAGGGWWAYASLYEAPAAALRDDIDALIAEKSAYETALLQESRVRRELDEIIAGAVQGNRESLEHRLRTASATLAFEAGLTRLEVNSLPPRALGNPAGQARGIKERSFQRTLRDRVDASESRVVISGEGTLEAVLRALALADAQRWTLGVDSWTIKPARIEEGKPAVFSLSMTLTALVVDDEGSLAGEIPVDPLDDRVLAQLMSTVEADPFRTAVKPEPVVAQAPPPPPPPKQEQTAPPPPPPGAGWRLAGVLRGQTGQYAIVVHESGRRRTLALGEEVGGLRLADVLGEVATFEANEERFEVRNGELLAAARGRERR
ncbi:hypothetical protein AY599_16580 [Leptolyngbya valderiana BDU 20041]|nr:hypothetical protein AY599_16580 [Leptolyngbya valderiana BDU 20041]